MWSRWIGANADIDLDPLPSLPLSIAGVWSCWVPAEPCADLASDHLQKVRGLVE